MTQEEIKKAAVEKNDLYLKLDDIHTALAKTSMNQKNYQKLSAQLLDIKNIVLFHSSLTERWVSLRGEFFEELVLADTESALIVLKEMEPKDVFNWFEQKLLK